VNTYIILSKYKKIGISGEQVMAREPENPHAAKRAAHRRLSPARGHCMIYSL
jgi:hypothetical protein